MINFMVTGYFVHAQSTLPRSYIKERDWRYIFSYECFTKIDSFFKKESV